MNSTDVLETLPKKQEADVGQKGQVIMAALVSLCLTCCVTWS